MNERKDIPAQSGVAASSPRRRWRWRRLAFLLCGAAVLALLLFLLLPWWFPPLAGVVLRQAGVEVARAERQGLSRFELQGVQYEAGTVRVRAEHLVLPLPGQWLYWWLQPPHLESLPLLRASQWTVLVDIAQMPPPDDDPPSWSETVDQIAGILGALRQWLPPAVLEAGQVEVAGLSIQVPRLAVNAGQVHSVLRLPEYGMEAELQLLAGADDRFEWAIRLGPETSPELAESPLTALLKAELEGELVRGLDGWTVEAAGDWSGNAIWIAADLSPDADGVWAREVSIEMPKFGVSAGALGLAAYDQLLGHLRIIGPAQNPAFDFSVRVEAGDADWPAAEVAGSGRVTTEELELSTFRVESAGLGVTLTAPAQWGWSPAGLRGPVLIALRADLGGQSFVPMTGRIEGALRLMPVADIWPTAALAVAGSDLEFWGESIAELSMEAQATGPRIEKAEVRLRTSDGSVASVTATDVDVLARRLGQAQVQAELTDGLGILRDSGLTFTKAAVGVTVRGDLAAPRHEGWLQVDGFQTEGLHTLALAADWQGESDHWIQFRPRISSAEGQITALGILTNRSEVVLAELRVQGRDLEPLALRTPTRLTWEFEDTGASPGLTLRLDQLELVNAQQSLELQGEVAWPARGEVRLGLQALDTSLLAPFVDRQLPPLRLDSLGAEASWDNGPVAFGLRFAGAHATPLLGTLRFAGELAGGADGVQVERLRLGEGDLWWANASGAIPHLLQLTADGPSVELRMTNAVHLEAEIVPSPLWQRWLEQQLGLQLQNARARVTVRGSPAAPEGEVRVTVGEVRWLGDGTNGLVLPPVQGMDVHVTMRPEALRLEGFRVEIGGRPLVGRGELPFPPGFWESGQRGEWALDLDAASAHVELPDFPLAVLSPETLQVLRPEGSVRAEVRLEPGGSLQGEVNLAGLATRALPMAGPIRRIRGRILLADDQVKLESIRVDLGGAQVELNGAVDLAPWWAGGEALPGLDLRLTGQRVPLARQAGLVIRSDLDLSLRRAPGQPPSIEGDVNLQRSFVLSDLDDLFGGTVRTAARPPPYFSVEQEPLAGCRLDITIRADDTLHVRSPFYRGSHSLNLRLRGTLRDPLLTGDIQVGTASVVFPYTSMPVRQGFVTFTQQDPEAPRLVVTAASRAFGYDLRMEVSGTLKEPSLLFTSTPSLTSEEILLMITAGELPRNEMQYGTRDRLAKLATILGKDILNKLGAQDASEERLTMRSGEGISAGGRVTHQLEYRLTDSWSMVAEYDEFDDLNAGVKWRIIRR